MVTKPRALARAQFVIRLCDRWHKTPDEILAMDTRALQMLRITELGGMDGPAPSDEYND